ncbi:MAG TPA: M56 family metallopeptidase [Prolixibacteraceae bacterium]|nr:M56 family metallopeptidase [Prolixibacteraceae bacterium]
MNDFLLYILKSTLSISLLYLGFRFLLRKETFFVFNRLLLLTAVACSTVIPLLYMPQMMHQSVPVQLMPEFSGSEIVPKVAPMPEDAGTIAASTPVLKPDRQFVIPTAQLLQFAYLAGLFVSFLILLHSIFSVLRLFSKARLVRNDGIRLFMTEEDLPAFSFGRNILISRHDFETNSKAILSHEQAHIRAGHFFDLILMEAFKIVHWFNPLVYWLIRDMKAIHEYQADDHTLNKGIDATQYQILIIQKCVGHQKFALANSFNHCQIKKRITMMNKQKTSKVWRWKAAAFLPLLALLLMAFGKTGENAPPESFSLPSLVQELQQDSVKQWSEDDFGIPGKLMLERHSKETLYAYLIQIDSKSKMKSWNEVISFKKLPTQIKKYLDYELADEKTKSEYLKLLVNGQEKMTTRRYFIIQKDMATPDEDYQKLLNIIGNTILEIRGKYASSIFNTPYTKLTLAQRNEIDKLIPSVADFMHSPVMVSERKNDQPLLLVEVRAEGIFVASEEKVSSMDELSKKAELFIEKNPNGIVSIKVAAHVPDDQITMIKEQLRKAKALHINYSLFTQVYQMVEDMPDFPGGNEALKEWISQNIEYPEDAKSKGIEGKVFVRFVVNSFGKVEGATIAKGISPELDAEALRVVSLMPEWTPGKQKGVPVCVAYTVPINFSTK